ncbi:hypothetical protein SUGI_1018090 [Cryptomeria japonica]|nr:hypothetical protein SUGI_1018090 [Cryptomeria japonica]
MCRRLQDHFVFAHFSLSTFLIQFGENLESSYSSGDQDGIQYMCTQALLSWIIMDYHFQELKIEGFTSARFKFEVKQMVIAILTESDMNLSDAVVEMIFDKGKIPK